MARSSREGDQVGWRDADALLVEASLSGEETAFGQLYDSWFDSVHDLARRIVGDDAAAADVAQDAFIKAWQGLDGLRDPLAFGGWLLRIARTTALNHNRAQRRSALVDTAAPGTLEGMVPASDAPAGFTLEDKLASATDPATIAENSEMAQLLFDAADALGERDSDVLDLHLRHGLEAAEIGEIVGINRNAANQLLHRLRRRLRRAVEARVLWRDGHPSCDELMLGLDSRLLTVFDDKTSRFIDSHAEHCDECGRRRRTRLAPAALFGAIPVIAASIYRQDVASALEAQAVPMSGSNALGPTPPDAASSAVGVSADRSPVSGPVNSSESIPTTGDPTMSNELTTSLLKRILKLRVLVFIAIGALIVALIISAATNGDDGSADPGGSDEGGDSGGSDEGGDSGGSDEGGDSGGSDEGGDSGGTGDDGEGSSGSNGSSVGGGASDGSGGSDGGSAGTDGSAPPPGGASGPTLCGPEEFLGGLPAFVAKIGDPNLLPPVLKSRDPKGFGLLDAGFPDFFAAPLLSTPMTIVGGANDAYLPLGDAVRSQCPHLSGDPHVLTIDGYRYDFQGVGEYLALRSGDGSIEVQVRTIPFGSSEQVSTVGGVALMVDGRTLVVNSTEPDTVTLDGETIVAPAAIRTDNDAYILRDDDEVAVFWPDGYTAVSITRLKTEALSIYFTLAAEYAGDVGGLMGNGDGERLNDLALPDGTTVDDDFESINRELRDAWLVTGAASLFDGPSQYRSEYPVDPVRLTSAEERAAREACVAIGVVDGDLLEECTFDVAVTGDTGFAQIHFEGQRDRIVVANRECDLAATGPSEMAGGPGRNWEIDPIMISGTQAWSFEPDDGVRPRVRSVLSSPDGTAMVIDSSNGVRSIGSDGQVLWTADADLAIDVAPLIVGDSAFVATTDGLAALSLDGQACWHLLTYGGERVKSLAHDGERIIATTVSSGVAIVLAIEPSTGEVLWSTPSEVATATVSTGTGAAIADGMVIVEGERGVVIALDASSGERVWTYEPDRADTVSALSVVDGVVYSTGRDTGLTALALVDGAHRWTTAAPAGGVTVRLAVGGGVAVVVDESMVRAIDLETGSVRWTLGDDDPVRAAQPVISGDLVYLPIKPRQLVGVQLSDGSEVLRVDEAFDDDSQNSNAAFSAAPVAFGDVLLIIASGDLVAYR